MFVEQVFPPPGGWGDSTIAHHSRGRSLDTDVEEAFGRVRWSLGSSLLPWIPRSLGLELFLVTGDKEDSTTWRSQEPRWRILLSKSEGADALTVFWKFSLSDTLCVLPFSSYPKPLSKAFC